MKYFWGASAYDLIVTYNILQFEVFKSIWFVVDAVNQTNDMFTKY